MYSAVHVHMHNPCMRNEAPEYLRPAHGSATVLCAVDVVHCQSPPACQQVRMRAYVLASMQRNLHTSPHMHKPLPPALPLPLQLGGCPDPFTRRSTPTHSLSRSPQHTQDSNTHGVSKPAGTPLSFDAQHVPTQTLTQSGPTTRRTLVCVCQQPVQQKPWLGILCRDICTVTPLLPLPACSA